MKSLYYSLALGLLFTSCAVQVDPINVMIIDSSTKTEPPVVITPVVVNERKHEVEKVIPPVVVTAPVVVKPLIPRSLVIVGCSPFVVPVIPDPPRVSADALKKIKRDDVQGMNDALLDNIVALNDYTKLVRKLYTDAYEKHKATCPGQKK